MTPRSRSRWTWLALVVAFVGVVASGPRAQVREPGPARASDPVLVTASAWPDDLRAWPAWLASRERAAGVNDTAVAARVVFAGGDSVPVRTAWSVVYLHGFSATRQETAPLAAEVAQQLGANLFEARLRGHGLPGDSLGNVTAEDWMRDARTALEAGRQLGDSVLVIGTSTGGTLGVWLATRAGEARAGLAALVLISPNFGPKDKASTVLTWPWAEQVLPRFIPYREWTPRNDEQARFWTVRYPTRALFPMQALVEYVRGQSLDGYDIPTLVFSNPGDEVVDARRTEAWLAELAPTTRAPLQHVRITPPPGEDGHVIAGRIVAPSQTVRLRDGIVSFVRPR